MLARVDDELLVHQQEWAAPEPRCCATPGGINVQNAEAAGRARAESGKGRLSSSTICPHIARGREGTGDGKGRRTGKKQKVSGGGGEMEKQLQSGKTNVSSTYRQTPVVDSITKTGTKRGSKSAAGRNKGAGVLYRTKAQKRKEVEEGGNLNASTR
ncbi:hypothetical protein R1sor_023752 [Riccia sorocarpa]|uniref:Uncharacterized protein n=1 Tax=Riccia sorocarpa TaxID=122646 RepID=A0ABD3GQ20_9MARC